MGSKKSKKSKKSEKKKIALERIIIHELKKEKDSNKAELELSTDLCINDSKAKELIAKLAKRYSQSAITYARFKTQPVGKPKVKVVDDDYKFEVAMDEYCKEKNDNRFIAFTNAVMKKLEKSIKNVTPAKGGYFVFADYEKYVGVFVIRHTKGALFEKNETDTAFIVNPATHIDFSAMAMACRIDKNEYKNKKDKYLNFISRKNEPIAQYFIEWFFAKDVEDSKNNTILLTEAIKLTPTPIDKKTKKPIPEGEFRGRAKKYIQSQPNGEVNVEKLGEVLYNNPKIITKAVEKKGKKMDTVVHVHPRALKTLEVIIANADEIELRFPAKHYKSKVKLVDGKPSEIIIDSLELANIVREQLALTKREIAAAA